QEVSRKERSIRILGKHLSGIQRERKQLEERLRQVEDELNAKSASPVESLIQSRRSLSAQPRPLSLPRQHLEVSGEERVMGAPEMAACQSLLSSIAQLYQTCSSRIDWLEQEVSAHRSHVTALQDVCLRDNLAYAPVRLQNFNPIFVRLILQRDAPATETDFMLLPCRITTTRLHVCMGRVHVVHSSVAQLLC
uniref:Uncharacterized protein n=1 Tax=Mola mola TaxID=94237 RepID=A0A3Q3WCL5_MOLML